MMKKKIEKEISHKEKLEFYHKYNDEEFLAKLRQTEDKYAKIGFKFLQIFMIAAVVGGFFSLWLCLFMLPAIIVPFSMMIVSYKINKKRIDNLTENMTYKKFMEMFDNGEWQDIVKELNEQIPENRECKFKTESHPSIIQELKNHDCPYMDKDKSFHEDNHDDLLL